VEIDKVTGELKGMPKEWSEKAEASPRPSAGSAPSKRSLFGILRGAKKEAEGNFHMEVSAPFNVAHSIHVAVDLSAPNGFRGLPKEWEAMLSSSGISKAEMQAHPHEVLDVLQFHMEGPAPRRHVKRTVSPPSASPTPPQRSAGEIDDVTDPATLFETLEGHKLGEGASGVVHLGLDKRTGKKVAIKVASAADLANLRNETALQALSQHPCIVSLVGTWLKKDQLWVRAA
jgi:P21-Rho-binding domain/Protein kinase domain